MTLKARLSNIKTVSSGTGISYGLTYVTKRPSIIGTIPLGYADGYKRALSNRGWVDIHGDRSPIVGRVCMDQCMIDLTDAGSVEIGDEVILFGGGCAPRVEEMAKLLDTIPHEVTCDVARRVPGFIRGTVKLLQYATICLASHARAASLKIDNLEQE